VGLAKKLETIVFPDARAPLNLPVSDPALQLLQRVRDEAHRFANTYSSSMRSRRIRESVLDDFPGLGPVRRTALLSSFRSVDGLRRASAEEIARVPGIGPKRAQDLHEFLARS
jgi:excinuclease ABC subunit C